MKNFKKWVKSQSAMKLVVLSVLFMFAFAGTSYAIWTFFIEDEEILITITSEGQPLSFSVSFIDLSLDTSNSSATDNTTATLLNSDGSFDMAFINEVIKTSTDENCTDFENDGIISFFYEGSEIYNNSNISVTAGTQDLTIRADYLQNSCPQIANVSIELTSIA